MRITSRPDDWPLWLVASLAASCSWAATAPHRCCEGCTPFCSSWQYLWTVVVTGDNWLCSSAHSSCWKCLLSKAAIVLLSSLCSSPSLSPIQPYPNKQNKTQTDRNFCITPSPLLLWMVHIIMDGSVTMGETFQASAGFQNSDIFQKAREKWFWGAFLVWFLIFLDSHFDLVLATSNNNAIEKFVLWQHCSDTCHFYGPELQVYQTCITQQCKRQQSAGLDDGSCLQPHRLAVIFEMPGKQLLFIMAALSRSPLSIFVIWCGWKCAADWMGILANLAAGIL